MPSSIGSLTRPGRRALAVALFAALAGLTMAGQAHAAIPGGNLLVNGDGEAGTAANTETTYLCPQSWTCGNHGTLVRYGTTTFPSIAESARIGGGRAFFAGGPTSDGGDSGIDQLVNLSAAAAEIDAGQ